MEPCPPKAVCLSEQSAVELGLWIRAAIRHYEDTAACPGVKVR